MSLRISGKHMEIGECFRVPHRRPDRRCRRQIFRWRFLRSRHRREVRARASPRTASSTWTPAWGCRRPARPRIRRPAFEAAADRIEKRLRRYKRKLQVAHVEHRPPASTGHFLSRDGAGGRRRRGGAGGLRARHRRRIDRLAEDHVGRLGRSSNSTSRTARSSCSATPETTRSTSSTAVLTATSAGSTRPQPMSA